MLNQQQQKTVADFFAGIGLVTMGLDRAGWKTIYALDYDEQKEAAYTHQFGSGHYHRRDVAEINGAHVPNVTLAHASFPCTDLSVAGARGGIHTGESSAFWQFARILQEMQDTHGDGRPPFVLLENVEGLLTSNDGNDLRLVLQTLNDLNYRVDLLRVDAANFVPQSRVRLFMIGVHESIVKDADMNDLAQIYRMRNTNARPDKIIEYINKNIDIKWYFHDLPNLPQRTVSLEDILDHDADWWEETRTQYLYNQLHDRHKKLVDERRHSDSYSYFPAFRRMRVRDGEKKSTVELRTDGVAGCLRTPKGGSARQILVRAGKGKIDARLINGREAARLMGADDFAIDPSLSLNQVLFGFGDAVCVPAVEWIAENYLDSLPLSTSAPLQPTPRRALAV